MSSIEMDFRQAKQQAEELEELARSLEQLAERQFAGAMQEISVHWKGENANAYLQKGSRLEANMKATAKEIKKTATQIRSTAKKIYDAEMFAKRLAEKRIYGMNGD